MTSEITERPILDGVSDPVSTSDHEWRTAMQHARGYVQMMKNRLANPTVSNDELRLLLGQALVGLERLRAVQMQMVAPLLAPTASDAQATDVKARANPSGDPYALPGPLPTLGPEDSPLLLLVAFAVLLLLLSYQ